MQHPAHGLGFDFAKLWLAVTAEKFSNGRLLVELDLVVKIEKGPAEQLRQRMANAGFPRAHESGKRHNRRDGRMFARPCL